MTRKFLLVGLTGGVATGKSTVAEVFRRLGCVIIDADVLAREVVAPGEPAYDDIVAAFGRGVLRPDGTLDRKKLGAIVFAVPDRRKRLEAITHPRIRERFTRALEELAARGFAGIVIFDAPVMIESGIYATMDRLVVVVTDADTQRARAVGRDADRADVERRIASQMPLAEKAKLADYVIDNSGDREATEIEAKWVHASLERESRTSRRIGGSPTPLTALFFRNAEHYGRNRFDPRVAAQRLCDADRNRSWVAYHRARPSAALVVRDPGQQRPRTAVRVARDAIGLACIARTFPELARLERGLPAGTSVTAHGKVVVGSGDQARNVVVVLLEGDVPARLQCVGQLKPRVEAVKWASDRDLVCLYDRPPRSGSNGQVERAVCESLSRRAGDGAQVVGTARAMRVVRDILDGRLGLVGAVARPRTVRTGNSTGSSGGGP